MVFICSRYNTNHLIGGAIHMQYLIKTTTHDTGEVFTDVIKVKQNERYEIVSAESKAEALSWYKEHKERTDWKSIDRKDSE